MKCVFFTVMTLSLSAHAAFDPEYVYKCDRYTQSYKQDYVKQKDTFTLQVAGQSGFLGWGPAWMSLTNDRVGDFMRFNISQCVDEAYNDSVQIDDRCAELYDYRDYGYFTKDGRSSDSGSWNSLPTWVNSNLRMSLGAMKGEATARLSTSEYGGEEPNGDVRTFNVEWRCRLQ